MVKHNDLESLDHPREGIASDLKKKIMQAAGYISRVLAFSMLLIIAPPLPFDEDDEIFGLSSILYMLLDPLFFYLPLINQETKCLMLDNKLKIAALFLRALGDIRYVLRIFIPIKNSRMARLRGLKEVAVSILSILPVPQVVILIFLPKMRGSRSFEIMKFLNSLILLQYLPRLYPIYKLCKIVNKETLNKKAEKNTRFYEIIIWKIVSPKNRLKFAVAVNIYGYILASHVLGAFWYFFSIQREIGCWGSACRIENGCEFSTSCDENTIRNITLLKNLCPISPPDAKIFDFGIFLYALQSPTQASTNFPKKFLKCFLWGLQSLSSFGSNLNTSTYVWENFFVVVISISGLILFMYLLGHAQDSNKSESVRRKMTRMKPTLDSLISDCGLLERGSIKRGIVKAVKRNLEKDEDLIVENMFTILSIVEEDKFCPKSLASEIKVSLFLEKLKKVEGLKGTIDGVLEKICQHLEPMIYTEGSFIIRKGELLDMMFFITQGTVLIYPANNGGSSSSSVTIKLIEKEEHSWLGEEKEEGSLHGDAKGKASLPGEEKREDSLHEEAKGKDSLHGEEKGEDNFYGEELLTSWANRSSNEISTLPISTVSFKSHKKVKIFAIKASDLHRVLYK